MKVQIKNTPKQIGKVTGRQAFYRYYAGFSSEYVRDIFHTLDIQDQNTVFDPWNGGGTTTLTASIYGCQSIGMDINPVMIIVSKAKQIPLDFWSSIQGVTNELILMAHSLRRTIDNKDALFQWVDTETAISIRALDRAIRKLLFPQEHSDINTTNWNDISSIASFFMVALFRAFRIAVGRLSSNPTWDKKPSSPINVGINLFNLFQDVTTTMTNQLLEDTGNTPIIDARIFKGDSKKIPLNDGSIDVIVSSPPYCTRIDYAVATLLELTILDPQIESNLRKLRESMLGSPIILKEMENLKDDSIGLTGRDVLDRIKKHNSKSSATYYYKSYRRYFLELKKSLNEIDRVLKIGGKGALVVQSSYYKDIEVNLPQIVLELTQELGMRSRIIHEVSVNQSMEQINTVSRQYNKSRMYFEKTIYFEKH
ncbi:hypothetical protein [Brevibacillus centrosporus]|uniref:Uncharacterized protein n=1 Tax=Brevibacillus centrosporus TaxID=54910 RepID=A0A1I3YCQ9_9BACL|nr:hypothetical protein [Brevibacillus centrosporus]SFK29523.1 hypothetical protein SAMN05518846_11164 [Brevibacillus centrosporus]